MQSSEKNCENGGMNFQKNQKNTKEHNSKSQKLKFVMTSVANINFQILVAPCTVVKCQKQTQIILTS
jgi:hypothetical protein